MKVEVAHDHPFLRRSRKETIRTIRGVLRKGRKQFGAISVVLTNNTRIRSINRKHLQHDYVTDVIAFELEASPRMEAEIYVNLDRARVQAKDYGDSFTGETRRLVIHGLLHLVGYDDKSARGRLRMKRKEDEILTDLRRGKN